ncbi:DNA/pantothenate metabolism flavoprotein domain-containing protein, putative [Eimeria necatrix]|uniref:DNA/pantothenate metabolism flavoprotein domain-containing protein, putative n=1 Tax=Eimeria necatrix TaxID=51315 RepID=U6MRC2_9EIME|nr:DNA/pantothenate metabolism flavoprotein domain-containing protein, putative [Eimeria necatrix]CDJ66541.1 DNA/pantothenate metabolism flavoprotein domain-containing protein, putative [Eimeria necatrix]
MADSTGSRSGAPSRLQTKAMEASSLPARRASLARFETSPADSFFASEPPPPNVATAGLRVRQFVRPLHEEEALKEAKVAIVTAGGTDVPLEREAVRYITNTSSGARGAALCEQLLRLGYYVILVTSVRAIKPFVRHLLPTYPMPSILDFISLRVQQQQQQQQGEAGEAGEQQQQQQREEEPQQQQQQQKLPLQPIVEEPSESAGSEEELEAPAAAATSRGLAYQVYEVVEQEVSEGVSVTSVGSVLSSSDSAAAAEDAAAAAAAAAEGSAAAARAQQRPPADAAEPAGAAASSSAAAAAAAAAAGPWQVSLKGPLQRGASQGPQELPEEEVEAAGWEFEGSEAEAALKLYRHCKDRLLCVTYQTLVEYAFIVRAVAAGAAPLRERLMFCSAAAVADFYLPYSVRSPHKLKTPQHHDAAHRAANAPGAAAAAAAAAADGGAEVQRGPSRSISTMTSMQPKRWFTGEAAPHDSYKGAGDAGEAAAAAAAAEASDLQQQHHSQHFSLRLWVAPKMLLVVRSVAPHCFLVAFKLETDESRLQQSATSYLEGSSSSSSSSNGSGVADCVVGNALRTRREKATLFTKIGQKEVKQKAKQIKKYLGHGTIEARLAKYLFKLQSLKIKEAFL